MRTWILLVAAAMLAGCTSGSRSILETLAYAARPDAHVESFALNPQFEYLRTIIDGRVAILALGYREIDSTLVYYSGLAETLHLRNGRVVQFTSSQKRIEIHSNPEVITSEWMTMNHGDTLTYKRIVDQRPGYVFSQDQSVVLTRLSSPPAAIRLVKLNRQALAWFEERIKLGTSEMRSIFAVDSQSQVPTVVYSEQCLTEGLCLTLQRWSASGAF